MYEPYFHIHHEQLVEQLTEPVENRVNFIKMKKNRNEILLRLYLMRPVPVSNLPTALKSTLLNLDRAIRVSDAVKRSKNASLSIKKSAQNSLDSAKAMYDRAFSKVTITQWNEIHKKACDPYCPWNGSTIFPKF